MEQTPNAEKKAPIETFASACPACLVIPTWPVNPSVLPTLTVPTTWLASPRNVKILVRELVASMLAVKSLATTQFARALMAILVIRSSVANLGLLPSNHRSSSRNAKSIPIAKLLKLVSNSVVLILASNDLVFVLQTPNAELSNIALSVCVLKDSLEILKSSVSKVSLHFKLCFFTFHKIIGDVLCSVGCRSDSDCPTTEACVNRQCKDPCVFETCGTNALCRVNIHRPQCFCPERHEGDPYRACRQPECLVDDDCPSNLACREKNCRDPCNCPPNTKCTVINHVPKCSCPAGYKGEPNTTKGCFLPGIS